MIKIPLQLSQIIVNINDQISIIFQFPIVVVLIFTTSDWIEIKKAKKGGGSVIGAARCGRFRLAFRRNVHRSTFDVDDNINGNGVDERVVVDRFRGHVVRRTKRHGQRTVPGPLPVLPDQPHDQTVDTIASVQRHRVHGQNIRVGRGIQDRVVGMPRDRH